MVLKTVIAWPHGTPASFSTLISLLLSSYGFGAFPYSSPEHRCIELPKARELLTDGDGSCTVGRRAVAVFRDGSWAVAMIGGCSYRAWLRFGDDRSGLCGTVHHSRKK
jgi:hypothetical protein